MSAIALICLYAATISPWSWAWRSWTFLLMLGSGLLILFFDHETAKGPGAAIGVFAVAIAVMPAAAIMAMRLVWQSWKATRKAEAGNEEVERASIAAPDDRLIRRFDLVLLATGGALTGLFCIGLLAGLFSGTGSGYLVHGAASLLSITGLILIVRPWLYGKFPHRWRSGAFSLSAAAIVAAVSVTGAFYPQLIISEALSRSGGHPHCIAMNASDRPVRSWQDLTFFTFDRGSRNRHHTVLLVVRGDQFRGYHWSYRSMTFRPGLWNWEQNDGVPPDVSCEVDVAFAQSLPLLDHGIREKVLIEDQAAAR